MRHAAGDAVHLSTNVALCHTGLNQSLGGGMHLVTNVTGTVNGGNLLWLLGGAHLDDSLDKLQ